MKHLESFEENTNIVTTELCVEFIVNHFKNLNSIEELCDPKNWKRESKKGSDIIVRIFKNKKTGDTISLESTKSKIIGITDTKTEISQIEKILLNPEDFEEAIEYYNNYNDKANKNNIFPLMVSYGKEENEWYCIIRPKFDDRWDLDNPYYIDEYLNNTYGIEGVAENRYEIHDIIKFRDFMKTADKRFFKFERWKDE